MLEYKIKDLKHDIAPREAEINSLKIQTQKMDDSLKTCNAVNSSLGFAVNDYRNRQDQMQKIITASRSKIRHNDTQI